MVRGTAYSLLSLVLARVLQTVGSILVARMLGKSSLGMLSIVNNIVNVALLLATVGIPTALIKYVAQNGPPRLPSPSSDPPGSGDGGKGNTPGDRYAVVGTAFIALLVPAVVLCSFLFFAADWVSRGMYHEPGLAPLIRVAAAILLISALGVSFGQALLQGLREVKRISIINIIQSAVGLPVVVGLTYCLHLTGAVIAQLLMAALGGVLVASGLSHVGFRWRAVNFQRRLLPPLANLAFPAFMSGLVMTPALWITTTRLSVVRGFADVGLFNICFALFQMVLFTPIAVGMPLVPLIAQYHTSDPERTRRLMSASLHLVGFVTLLLSVLLSLFAGPVILLLYGRGYVEAAQPMIIMTGTVTLTSLGYVVGHYFAGTGKMWTGMAFNLMWFAVVVASAFLLITPLGASGLALGFLIAYFVMTAGVLVYARQTIGVGIGYPALVCVLSMAVAAFAYWCRSALQGWSHLGAAVAVLALAAGINYWLLPAKGELRDVVALLIDGLRRQAAART